MRDPRKATVLQATLLFTLSLSLLLNVQQLQAADFNHDIQPILAQHCLECHGPDEDQRQSELRLDNRADALVDLGGYAAIVPGDPDNSELLRRIETEEPSERMPPAEHADSLTTRQLALLREWIEQGADYQQHWAYQPIRRPAIPDLAELPSEASEIDRFIIAALQRAGLKLSPPLDRQALIRRATFDLIGLPPTWEDVQRFVNDADEHAFEKVVDRLLASRHYGERWGRYWLDIARYADTHGGGAIGFTKFPFSYTYRDYVIKAFNRDLRYDRFLREQIAADQLGLAENDPALAALGFLTVGRQYRVKHDMIDDQIDVVTRGLLGLTVTCARCHDHKFDQIPTTDYYSLYAVFASSQSPEQLPIIGQPATTEAYGQYQAELARRDHRRAEMTREQTEVLRHRLRMQVGLYLKKLAKGTPEQDLEMQFLSYRTDDTRPLILERWRDHLASLTIDDPVFGPWHRLSKLSREEFPEEAASIVARLEAENGDTSELQLAALRTEPPRWNPRVLAAIKQKAPGSMLDVAEAYGELFARVEQEWLEGLLSAALEARPEVPVVPDEDARHASINSAVNRQLRYHLYGPETPTVVSDEIGRKLLNRPVKDFIGGLRGSIHNLHLASPGSPPRAMILREQPSPEQFHVFRRGNPIDRGVVVEPRFLEVLSPEQPKRYPDGRRRLALAETLTDPANPLTRRVIVNWVWQRHFGVGLVRTPDDFGTRGTPPTHPELLDYLADKFLHDGWSIKRLHRHIMLSMVYQQSAEERPVARNKDPENQLLWRMPRRRLDLEAMRDAMLAVAGRLDTTAGGRPFDLLAEPFINRRSVYGFVNRDVIPSFFSTFDMADPSVCVAQRPATTVPQQTLFALNSNFIQQQAQSLATRQEVHSAQSDAERVTMLYKRALSRMPTDYELQASLQYIQSQGDQASWQRLAHILLASNEFVFVD